MSHATFCHSFVLVLSALNKQLCNMKHSCVPQDIFGGECTKYIIKALLILV